LKQARRIPKLRYVILVVVAGWALYHYWYVQRPMLTSLTQKQSQLQASVSQLQKQKQQLTEQRQLLNDPNYLARYASRWGYTKKGEVPFDVGK
jgi:cell division protein FtsB